MNTTALQHRWQGLSARERAGLRLAAVALLLSALWLLALAPAWQTLRQAPHQRQQLAAQEQTMRALQDQARALQARPARSPDTLRQAIQASLAPLGASAQLQWQGNQAVLTLRQVPPGTLAPWLAGLRQQSGLLPGEARLQREPAGWSGTLQFQLPAP